MFRKLAVATTALAATAGCSTIPDDTGPSYAATITRTTYNIPHIEADTWSGVGYGVAYAYAQDNFCMLAEEFVTLAGERSLYFGPEGKTLLGLGTSDNLTSDTFFRSQIDLPALRNGVAGQSETARALLDGYVKGYNRYLADTRAEGLPEACNNAPWVRPITDDDLIRLNEKQVLLASSLVLAPGIANAAPPGGQSAQLDLGFPTDEDPKLGSNGWAFGADATANGKGLVIGNPHFPWEGPARFWQMHVRGPDGYDAMGVGIAGTPMVTLGFNKDIAWTHTVTAARHFTIYALTLAPGDPTSYMLDGKKVQMEAREVSVPMPDGADPVVRTLYTSEFGPIVIAPSNGVQWSKALAFALRDANSGNQRAIDTWLGIGTAGNVSEIEAVLGETLGIPWVNTIAADRYGNALHADITSVPNVTADLVQSCATPFTAAVANLVTLLDGSRSECDWRSRPTTAPVAGLLPADQQASRIRRDYVTNSNDSYWISNPRDPYKQLSPILGAHSKTLSLRTRSNFMETEAALAAGKIDLDAAKTLVFGNNSLAADLTVDPLLSLCEGRDDMVQACAALAGWDRQFETDSRGAYLFTRFWLNARQRTDLWQVAFDPENPIETPAGLVTEGATGEALLKALSDAAELVASQGIALDAAWGDVQFRRAGDVRIAVHGGRGTAGVLNMQRSRPVEGGVTPVHGSSYVQIVGFDDDGPVADAILSYSQSTNPASPHYADQTRIYSRKQWHRLPFTDAEIAAAQIADPVVISE